MQKVRTAIIGQGRSGRDIHAAALKLIPEKFEIVAIVDPIEARRQRAQEELKCDVYENHRALFKRKDLDLIINATPSHLHYPVTLEIIKKGYNVLCEKPLAKKAKEVDRLMAAAQKTGKMFAIFQQSRFAPYFCKVCEVIDSGVLGRIVQISIAFNGFGRRWDWQTLQDMNGGNLLNTGPHPLDQALVLFGQGMPKILCRMDRANSFGDAEDYVKLVMWGDGHPVIDLEISSCCAYPCFTYNIQGTRGGMKGTTGAMEWKYFKAEEAPAQKAIREPISQPDGTPAYCREQLTWHTGSWAVPKDQGDLFAVISGRFYNMLYNRITSGTPLEITPEQVRRQIAVIEECHKQNPQIYVPKKKAQA